MDATAFLLVALGVVVMVAGAWVLWWGRRVGPGSRGGAPQMGGVLPLIGRVSEPTRLLAGVAGLVLGYHLGMWGLPEAWRGMHVPAADWYWVVGVAALVVAGSVVLDRMGIGGVGGEGDAGDG